jgi:hypothetical protein
MGNDSNHMSIGGERERAGLGWSARADTWDQRKDATPATPTPAGPETKEADEGSGDAGTLFVGYDADDVGRFRNLLRRGVMTPEALQKSYALSDEEMAALGEIGKSETEAAESAPETDVGDTEIARLEQELQQVIEQRPDANGDVLDKLEAKEIELRNAIMTREANQYLGEDAAPELLGRWDQAGGVEIRFSNLVGNVKAVKATLGDKAMDFAADLDKLPVGARIAFMDFASVEPGADIVRTAKSALRGLSGNDKVAAEKLIAKWAPALGR